MEREGLARQGWSGANLARSGLSGWGGKGRPGLARRGGVGTGWHVRGREVSDGVVTVSSATWGTFDPNLWPGDHADEIGHDLDRPLKMPDADTLHRYERIVLRF